MSRLVRGLLVAILVSMFIVSTASAMQQGPVAGGTLLSGSEPQAQGSTTGSIRGTVYHDRNGDGSCVGTGEPALAGITIKFTTMDLLNEFFLQSGNDGTYGLSAAGLGSWVVSAQPPAGYRVTSENDIEVFLSESNPIALGINFCVADASAVGTPILPETGASVAPEILLVAALGAVLVTTGTALELKRRRRTTSERS